MMNILRAMFFLGSPLLISSLAAAEPAPATPKEVREYEILVSGKPSGKSATAIVEQPDGRTVVATAAEVRVNFVVFEYVYTFDGAERWQKDQLTSFECQAVDGGTKCVTKGTVGDKGSQVIVDGGQPATAPKFAMSTNYWRPPTAEFLDKTIPIIDTDTGKTFNVKFERVGEEKLNLMKKEIACTRYRLTGDREADLWFDGRNRLVKQACVEDGYPTEVRLISEKTVAAKKS